MQDQIPFPSSLGRLAYPQWQFPHHLQQLQRQVIRLLTDPTYNRLIVEMPVRHGKSIYSSHILPAWYGMKYPDRNCTVVSYGSSLAGEFSAANRDMIAEWGPKLTGVGLHPQFQSAGHFRLAPPFMGHHRGMGIGGGLAGTGAHLIIADDLVKEFSEIATEEAREMMYRRFHGELLNRLEPGGKIMVIMSRRHPDDLSGRLLETNAQLSEADQWHSIKFKALSDEGVALWPERYNVDRLEAIRRDYELAGEPWIWHGLYQQDPATAAELCEWPSYYWDQPFYYTEKPDFKPVLKLAFLDPSKGKDARKGDFCALLYGEVDPQDTLWVDEPIMVRVPTVVCEDMTVDLIKQRKPDAVGIEVNGFQEVIAQNIYAKAPSHSPIYPYVNTRAEALAALRRGKKPGDSMAGKGKEVDIRMILTPLLSRHDLRIRDTPQGRILGQQLRDFPLATHDDGPDALAGMVRMWRDLLGGRPQTGGGKIHTA